MKKLLLALAALALPTAALADHGHDRNYENHYSWHHERHNWDRGNHYGWRRNYVVPYSYGYNYYSPYDTDSYWRYQNYYRCHRKNGGIGVLVDPYTGQLVLEIGSRHIVCR